MLERKTVVPVYEVRMLIRHFPVSTLEQWKNFTAMRKWSIMCMFITGDRNVTSRHLTRSRAESIALSDDDCQINALCLDADLLEGFGNRQLEVILL